MYSVGLIGGNAGSTVAARWQQVLPINASVFEPESRFPALLEASSRSLAAVRKTHAPRLSPGVLLSMLSVLLFCCTCTYIDRSISGS